MSSHRSPKSHAWGCCPLSAVWIQQPGDSGHFVALHSGGEYLEHYLIKDDVATLWLSWVWARILEGREGHLGWFGGSSLGSPAPELLSHTGTLHRRCLEACPPNPSPRTGPRLSVCLQMQSAFAAFPHGAVWSLLGPAGGQQSWLS